MRGLKEAIDTFLESKVVHYETNQPREQTMRQCGESNSPYLIHWAASHPIPQVYFRAPPAVKQTI